MPSFELLDQTGTNKQLPSENGSIICFIKEDCPTCKVILPLLKALAAQHENFHLIGQTATGNQKLMSEHGVTSSLLDDSKLKISFALDIEIVPTLLAVDSGGKIASKLEGFVRQEWQDNFTELNFAWPSMPEWRAGCGSLSLDPVIADKLKAESENSPIRARKIEVASADDEFEFMFDQGFSDGLPLVPPTPERVIRMLAGTKRDPQEIIANVPPNMGAASVEKIAINAVMAGCKPEYLPVVIASVEAACTDEFNVHGVMATTMGAAPVMVVNGPIRERIGMNMKLSALGQGNRANATIGRALRLVIRNIGGAVPGGTERPTLGNPMKFTMCFAEWEERSPWQPLHVERGFDAEDSVVTLFCMTSGPTLVVDQTSLNASQLSSSIAMSLEGVHHPKAYMGSDTLLVLCPEHLDTLQREGPYEKATLKQDILEATRRPLSDLVQNEKSGVGIPADKFAALSVEAQQRTLTKFKSENDIHVVVAGSDAGKFSGAFHGWVTGPGGSIVVSKKIED